jgi:Xaa-Pro dipeptidase
MVSRREFVQYSAVATAGALYRGEPPADAGLQQGGGPMPPSIAALASMRDRATPITVDERRARIERARELMRANTLDAMVLTGGTSLEYFTGIRWGLSERMLAVVVPVAGRPFLVCPGFEEDRAREQVQQGPLADGTDIRIWQEDESPYALVADGLKGLGIVSGRLGVEETVRYVFSDGVAHAAPSLTLASATPVSAGCRGVKSAHEIELMRLASQVTLKAYHAAYLALKEGMTQDQFAGLVSMAHRQLGFSGGAGVQVGPYSALPHGSITPQVVRDGTILLIDGGCRVEGYNSDLSRTFVLGKATDKMKAVFAIEQRAQAAALAAARPGVECQAVDAAARKVITDSGYGPDYQYFTHRVGHGIGMDGHEWPYLVRGNTLKLQPGMTFSDEPGIYIQGEFGVRLEDDMLITADGAELLTPTSPSLEDPFGNLVGTK